MGVTHNHETDETKHSFKTTELPIYVLAVLGVLIASAVADRQDFGTQEAWQYITFLTVGYLLSRGLAKSGSRAVEHHDNHDRVDVRTTNTGGTNRNPNV
jgi:hypothetical protein